MAKKNVAAPSINIGINDTWRRYDDNDPTDVGDFARNYDAAARGQSSYFVWLNRGKESLVIDIKNADHAALLRRIVARADVFIENLGPGAARRAKRVTTK